MRSLLFVSLLLPAIANADPMYRVGIDGALAAGLFPSAGGEVRAEIPLGGRHAMTVRGEWRKTLYLFLETEEGGPEPAWNLFGGYLGTRAYWNSFYFEAAAGLGYLQRDDFVDDTGETRMSHSLAGLAARIGIGGKIAGRFDIGIDLMYPAFAVGVHMGIDLGVWE